MHELDERLEAQRRALISSPSFRLAWRDLSLFDEDDLRPVRLMLEQQKPELYLRNQDVRSTICVFGSARIPSPEKAQQRLEGLLEHEREHPDGPMRQAAIMRARKMLEMSRYYEEARRFGAIVSELCKPNNGAHEFVIVTGGGPGIMEAANRGAFETGNRSVGLAITLPHEEEPSPYVTPSLCFKFHYFAIRKMHFLLRAKALIAFPGGFGTIDELFDALTLVQTRKIEPMPIILVGREYWMGALNLDFMAEHGMISAEDVALLHYADTAEEIISRLSEDCDGFPAYPPPAPPKPGKPGKEARS